MRFLITGGNGFVGRELTRYLLADHEVHVLDNLRSGSPRFARDEVGRFTLHFADLFDARSVKAVVDDVRPEVTVHLAAVHYIPECERFPELAVSTNVAGTVNLVSVVPEGTRFVFASSAAVYAPSSSALHEETSALGPIDVYGTTKLQAEQWVRRLAKARSLSPVVVRLFNVVGPGETNPHVVPEIVAQLKAGRRTLELGNTESRRDFIHVQDAAVGFHLAATGEVGDVPTTVNLGGGTAHSIGDLVDLFRDVLDEDITISSDPSRMRRVDNPLLLADMTRFHELFGWRPRRVLREAVQDLWSNPDIPPSLIHKYAA